MTRHFPIFKAHCGFIPGIFYKTYSLLYSSKAHASRGSSLIVRLELTKSDHKSFVYHGIASGDPKKCYNKRTQKHIGLHGKASISNARCCCLTLWLSVTDAVNAYACGEFPKCTTYNSHNSSKNQLETNDFSLVCQLSLRLISFKHET
uniref:Uncharacterized protein n=1 Tax=Glossina pallidipes TaxID=7398 RepID=A0A1B0ADP4_GLOPL